jgi:excisionase family DNA binding protein
MHSVAFAAMETTNMSSEKRAYQIEEFCEAYGVGKSKFHEEVAAGRLKVVRIGRRVLVTADDADAWLKSLPDTFTPRAERHPRFKARVSSAA